MDKQQLYVDKYHLKKCLSAVVIKKKNDGEKMRCKKCNNKIEDTAIYCESCGQSTQALSNDLSAKKTISATWKMYSSIKESNYKFSILFCILFVLPSLVAIYVTRQEFLWNSLAVTTLVPLLLLPFSFSRNGEKKIFSFQEFFKNIHHYPKLLVFVLSSVIYYTLIKIICTGKFTLLDRTIINYTTDPILHLVRFVLVLYWIAIILPVPAIMFNRKLNPLKAIILAYKAGKETRWQQFFIAATAFALNLAGAGILGLGLLITIPFTFCLIENYYKRMDDFKLFDMNSK